MTQKQTNEIGERMKKLEKLTKKQEAQLKPWADKWIKNAMSTKPMTEKEKQICRKAVKGLYKAAGLVPLPDHRIVFVPSPFVLRFASGFASAIWYMRKNPSFRPSAATRTPQRTPIDPDGSIWI